MVTELTRKCIDDNSYDAQSQERYIVRYNGYVKRYETAKTKAEKQQGQKAARQAMCDALGAFMFELSVGTMPSRNLTSGSGLR